MDEQNIEEFLKQEAGNFLKPVLKETLNTYIIIIKQYFQQVEDEGASYNIQKKWAENLFKGTTAEEYRTNKMMNRDTQKLLEILEKGYKLVNQIRQRITGEKISYVFGWIDEEGNLIETQLEEENLSKYMKLDKEARTQSQKNKNSPLPGYDKLKLDFKKILEDYKTGQLIPLKTEGSTVYSKVMNGFFQHRGSINEGIKYETYKRVLAQVGDNRKEEEVTDDMIEQAYIETKAGGGKYGSFRFGGDVGNIQLKFFGGRAASVTNINTILNSLEEIYIAFINAINNPEVQIFQTKDFENLFIRPSKKTKEVAKEVAEREIIKNFKKSSNKILLDK